MKLSWTRKLENMKSMCERYKWLGNNDEWGPSLVSWMHLMCVLFLETFFSFLLSWSLWRQTNFNYPSSTSWIHMLQNFVFCQFKYFFLFLNSMLIFHKFFFPLVLLVRLASCCHFCVFLNLCKFFFKCLSMVFF